MAILFLLNGKSILVDDVCEQNEQPRNPWKHELSTMNPAIGTDQ